MTPSDIPTNSIALVLEWQEDETLKSYAITNLTDTMPEDEAYEMVNMLNGMVAMVDTGHEFLSLMGLCLLMIREYRDEEQGIVFEPDEELIKAMSDEKIVPFNKNKMN